MLLDQFFGKAWVIGCQQVIVARKHIGMSGVIEQQGDGFRWVDRGYDLQHADFRIDYASGRTIRSAGQGSQFMTTCPSSARRRR